MNSSSKNTILVMVVLATFAFCSSMLAAVGDTLSVSNGSGLPGTSGHIVPVNLRNVTTIKALMFKVRDIPDSITVTGVTATGRASGFRAEMATFGGTVKVLMFPTDNLTSLIAPGTGAICNLTMSVDVDAEHGSKATLYLDSLVVANNLNQSVTCYKKNGYFWFGTKGDVKNDGNIDLFDVLRLIDIALNRQPSPTEYERWAGDLNGDGVIDVVDISMCIDLAVASTPSWQEMPSDKSNLTMGSARLDMPSLPKRHTGSVKIPLTLKASEPVSGMQLLFKVDPYKYQISMPEITALSREMSVSVSAKDDYFQVLVYSLTGEPIPAGEGAVLMLPVTILKPLAEDCPIKIQHALLATVGGGRLQAIYGDAKPQAAVMPQTFALMQNNPNPFNMSTNITYEVPTLQKGTAKVCIMLYNAQGQVVRVLEDQERAAGRYTVNWDGRDETGKYVSS
ncbi:hypothetical protein JXO59_07600, partial [candidate division KSB1 bacterium]|nr:hypothetical protein [candidate division KSB1 bacterium]